LTGSSRHPAHALYAEHHAWLVAWLRRRLGDGADAADLAQDTFLRLLLGDRAPDRIGPQPRALLTHIAKGLMVDHWRRKDVERAYLDAISHLPPAQAPSGEDRLILIESLMRIDAVLGQLPRQTREIFLLAQLDGLTLQQIADCTGVAVITVRRHVKRALIACMAAA
jgi:RNA polymerase sigma-70 factor (ECF subfamily)